jgi:DNA transposition AAA+ family ATPase
MNLAEFEVHQENPEPLDIGTDTPQLEIPAQFGDRYSEQDRADVTQIVEWLNRTRKTQSWLARISRVNNGTLNQVLKGSYTSPPTKFLKAMLEAIASQDERMTTRGVPFVETTVWRLAVSVYHRARTYQNIGVFSGYVGTGKTTAALEYARRTPNVYVVECTRNMSATAVLDELCEKLSLTYEARGASKEKKFLSIVRALRGTESLLIIDEADTISPEAMHYVRRIRDMARIGIVLQGTQNLLALLKPEHGRFDQIRSRIGFWPNTVAGISRQDADEVALAAFDDVQVDRQTLDAMWDVCGGSVRLLCESLIPAIRDYGLRKGRPMNAALVRQIAIEALRISPSSRRENP